MHLSGYITIKHLLAVSVKQSQKLLTDGAQAWRLFPSSTHLYQTNPHQLRRNRPVVNYQSVTLRR